MAGVLAGLFLVSSFAFAMRARLAGWVQARLSDSARIRLNAPGAVTLIAGLAWLAVAIASALRIPQPFGPDVMGHVQYLDWITEKGALPLATDGWSTYHPPLFYLLSALIQTLFGGASWALKILPFAAGLGQVLLARWVAVRVFPGRLVVQAIAIAFAAAIPMNLYFAQFFTNEGLAGFLMGCTICQAINVTARDTYMSRELAWLGLFAGLALLTKYSALVAVVAVIGVLAVHLLGRRKPIKQVALSLGVVTSVTLLIAGGFYLRNYVLLGSVFPGNWQFQWWQDPGFHTFEYWTRIGGWLSNPFKVGLNSFPDSLYATFFGDAMLGGDDPATGVGFHHDLVAAVMLIGLPVLPLLALGASTATAQIVRAGSGIWSLVMAPSFGLFLLVAYACSTHPYYSVAKSFYALGAVVPLALLFAAGFEVMDEFVSARASALRVVLYGWLGMFAGGVFLAYWL
jgi:4-amino-4-deoxy-L-arabinose transferase-like glycosyltransferase